MPVPELSQIVADLTQKSQEGTLAGVCAMAPPELEEQCHGTADENKAGGCMAISNEEDKVQCLAELVHGYLVSKDA